ncbi:WXG100 family type VII secretion target [Streptomyces sp. NPDC052496]|uniref:WXG100 family type VII secretion target n=1 Tax=Streptomyces sp. NPDC052496 TaxID=3154951 RepID=UPI00341A879C
MNLFLPEAAEALSVARDRLREDSKAQFLGGPMAGDGFDVDTDQLKSAAPRFHREADALAKATAKLKGSLDGLGAPWGDDEQGQKFQHMYAPHRTQIEKAAQALVKGLESISKAMKDMADNHEEADRSSATGFDKGGAQ